MNRTNIRAGADEQAIADYQILADAKTLDGRPIFNENTHIHWLSRVISGERAGINRDAPFYELFHFVMMIDAASPGTHSRWLALYGIERQSGSAYRDWFVQTVNKKGWRKSNFDMTKKGIKWNIDGREYHMLFDRMPYLSALYQFMTQMENGKYYIKIDDFITQTCDGYVDDVKIRTGTKFLAKIFKVYRRAHFARAPLEEKYNFLYRYLVSVCPRGRIVIDDQNIFTFWLSWKSREFVNYTTVAEDFIKLHRLFVFTEIGRNLDSAVPIGGERNEWDVTDYDEESLHRDEREEWISPLDVLNGPPCDAIKFLKKSEQEPLKNLAKYGPVANAFPLTILRLNSFVPIQSAISNDLRLSRDNLSNRLSCEAAMPYSEIKEALQILQTHLLALQKATLWAIHSGSRDRAKHEDKVVVLSHSLEPSAIVRSERLSKYKTPKTLKDLEEKEREKVLLLSKKSFDKMTRKGFEAGSLDDDGHLMGFSVGAGAITEIVGILESFLNCLNGRVKQLDQSFVEDRVAFSNRFQSLYGGLQ